MRTYNHLYENMGLLNEFIEEFSLGSADNVLVRIHSAIHSNEQMEELASEIRRLIPAAQVIGCSTMQVICEGKLYPSSCLVSVTVFEKAQIQTARMNCMDSLRQWKSGRELALEMARNVILGREGFLLLFFPLAYSKIEDFVDTVNKSGIRVKMLGGAAYMEDENGVASAERAYVLEGDETSMTNVVMAFITAEELHIYGEYVCGVEAVGKKSRISTRGCYIEEVDGMSGAEWYASLLDKDTLQNDPDIARIFPIVKREERGIAYYVEYIPEEQDVAAPKDQKQYRLKTYGEICDGSYVSIGYFHPKKVYDQVRELFQNIGQRPAETIFAYDCQSRAGLLHNCAKWEIGNFYTTSISGALLSGEVSCENDYNVYANYTFVTAVLSEHEESRAILREREQGNILELQQDNVQMLNYLLINANNHLNREVQDQQKKMQEAMFLNSMVGVDNQLRYLYDKERLNLDKLALFVMNNERMIRIFSGITKTCAVLRNAYEAIKKYYLTKGLYLYSYEDTSMLIAADENVAKVEFIDSVRKIQNYLNEVYCDEVKLDYTVAVAYGMEDSVARADSNVNYAKSHKMSFVSPDDIDSRKRGAEEVHIARVIKEALLKKRVIPFFQEIHNNQDSNAKKMYESLMRIYDEKGNIYYPDQFLPVAKEYDLYESLSELMVETVINMFWDRDVIVTINLNVQDIYDRKMIRTIFDNIQTVPRPENYVFEIVESEEITDYEYICKFAQRIHQLGAKIAIDDFGSGFSNLLHVLQIEADYIKIEGKIIKMIGEDKHCREFIRLINSWCAGNNQEVIAEFVENQEIQSIIEDIGICYSQGYYFSKPHRWGDEE